MLLQWIELRDFRNHAHTHLEALPEGVLVAVGANGEGNSPGSMIASRRYQAPMAQRTTLRPLTSRQRSWRTSAQIAVPNSAARRYAGTTDIRFKSSINDQGQRQISARILRSRSA